MNSLMQTPIGRYNVVIKGRVQDVDIDRKLGIGNEYLKEIKYDTSTLHDIKHDTSMLPDVKSGIDSLNTKFDSYLSEQRAFNARMDEHNNRLEEILDKLSEK